MTIEQAEALGWAIERRSFYDEEGVEGWEFTSPAGKEFSEIGDWNDEPPWPDELLAIEAAQREEAEHYAAYEAKEKREAYEDSYRTGQPQPRKGPRRL
jgi:hypothetical protein